MLQEAAEATDMTAAAPATRRLGPAAALVLLAALAGCITPAAPPPGAGLGETVAVGTLPGWRAERHAQAWPALVQSCKRLAGRDPAWKGLCADAALFAEPDDDTARAFFETRFEARVVRNEDGPDGLITGYYEPLLEGSLVRSARYRYPLYKRPDDLLLVDLGEVYPELKGRTLRGRLAGRRVVPYFSRAEIHNGKSPLAGNELVWVDDPVALFFLQVQGSGRVRLPDGQMLFVGYADQNGHAYQSVGRRLIELGALKAEDVNLESIRAWLKANPGEAEAVLNGNPSYVFFALRDAALPGPLGTLNVPLTRERSVAVDPAYLPLGAPLWLDTTLPSAAARSGAAGCAPGAARANGNGTPPPARANGSAVAAPAECAPPYRRLLFAQDTGGAIKGAVRADVFFGFGPEAERLAGHMKQKGRLYLLVPARRNGA
jgi:membrane-bound lytic murein transglycosylase A